MSVLVKTKSLYDRLLTRIYLGIFMLKNWVFWLLYDSFQLFENGGCLKNLYLEKSEVEKHCTLKKYGLIMHYQTSTKLVPKLENELVPSGWLTS